MIYFHLLLRNTEKEDKRLQENSQYTEMPS